MKPARQKGTWIEIENENGWDAGYAEPGQRGLRSASITSVQPPTSSPPTNTCGRVATFVRDEGAAYAAAETSGLMLCRIESIL